MKSCNMKKEVQLSSGKRLDKIQAWFHDTQVSLRTAEKCGKSILSIGTAANICDAIEELIKEIRVLNKTP